MRSTTAEYRSGNKMFFVHLPVAETRDDGSPVMNPYFGSAFTEKFVNKMSRVIIACQDGGGRSELAAKIVTDAGFTSIAVVAGALLPSLLLPRAAQALTRARARRRHGRVPGGVAAVG